MLTNLQLRNIKCFDILDITLLPLNILTGVNGAGKSTVIQSILLAEQSADQNSLELNGPLAEIGDYSDLLHEVAEDDAAQISITVEKQNYCWGYTEGTALPNKAFISELPCLGGDMNAGDFSGFSDFLYISAERWGPRNNVPLNKNSKNKNWLGKHGEYTIPVLGTLSSRTRSGKENEKEDILSENDPRYHKNQSSRLIFNNIVEWMGEISPNVTIDAQIVRDAVTAFTSFGFGDSAQYKATNVGFGLSYALSVVTALLISEKGSLVVIENPEAHLHPRGQSKLGQLIGLAAKAGIQVITETHSEHVINGARILVRKNILPASEMNLLYFQRDDKEKKSTCEKLDVNEVGQISKWPEGFFDQQAIDMKTLMTGE